MTTLIPEPLTAEAFAPYGSVISTEGQDSFGINAATCQRFDSLAHVDVDHEGGTPIISIFRAVSWPAPIEIKMLEKHPLGSQAFFPLQGQPWLIVVGLGDSPEAGDCTAFVARGDQGIQFNRNCWHHPLLVFGAPQDFLVVDRRGPGANCDEHPFTKGAALIDTSHIATA